MLVNIEIMRAFVRLRQILATHKDLARKIETLERKDAEHDAKFQVVFEAIRKLIEPPPALTPSSRLCYFPAGPERSVSILISQ